MLMLLTWKTLVIEHAQKPIFRLYVYYLLWLTVEYYKYRMKLRRFGLFYLRSQGHVHICSSRLICLCDKQIWSTRGLSFSKRR